MSETTFIYALCEPDTGEIRYIGKADDPKERFRHHLMEAKKTRRTDHKNNWLRSLASEPLLEVIDEILFEHWQQWEVAYIEFFKEQGCRLVNTCPGGDGIVFTQEIRDKMSESMKGNQNPSGCKRSPETRKKLSMQNLGENNPNFGKVMSMEQRAKISAAKLGTPAWNRGKKKGQV